MYAGHKAQAKMNDYRFHLVSLGSSRSPVTKAALRRHISLNEECTSYSTIDETVVPAAEAGERLNVKMRADPAIIWLGQLLLTQTSSCYTKEEGNLLR